MTQTSQNPVPTRERIQKTAIELFSENGYERTSLREIAEHLGLTKAALYYHFKTKEDIAASFFDSYAKDVDVICDWGDRQPRDLETRRELLRRYAEVVQSHVPVMRFMQHNQAALTRLDRGSVFQNRLDRLRDLLVDQDEPLTNRLRAWDALTTLYSGLVTWRGRQKTDTDQQMREAALEISMSLIDANSRA
ncbi:TetR/AcrR family transcriptional regulator [Salininema proteolyticum]|uniref:TetR/AcrR family transcriptional regulator n=1 Tax=Salininema proteolyticum TaxID=1607685 RepID=A0ABV8U223_9ACTN